MSARGKTCKHAVGCVSINHSYISDHNAGDINNGNHHQQISDAISREKFFSFPLSVREIEKNADNS